MWKLPLFESHSSLDANIDSEIVAVFQDSAKKAISPKGAYGVWIQRLRKAQAFEAQWGALSFVRQTEKEPVQGVLFLGLGTTAELTDEKLRVLGGNVWTKLVREKCREVAISVDSFLAGTRNLRPFAEGLILSAYQFNKYKSKAPVENDYSGPVRFSFYTRDKGLKLELDKELVRAQAIGEAVRMTRDWSNEPSNIGTPTYYATEAKSLARQYGLKYRVLTEKEAAREKMGLFLGVGQGSEQENRFVIVEYVPKNVKNPKTIALVGKGVTFDSGGISIKPSARMEEMKHDMTGAATVMGATLLASAWKIKNRVIAIMAFTENMPDGKAIQPGNILTARNGKTVEVINTDAEGRLILADALDFAQDFKPDAVVDVATLTGAASIALGKLCCAILGNDEGLVDTLRRTGEATGERMWQLPLFDEYFDDMKSDTADMKNAVNDSYGGTIRGAVFLKQFIRKGTQWAHLDIASTAYNLTHLSYCPKRGASGVYVRTLARFLEEYV